MPSLWFVTPVYGRVGITRFCLAQRHRAIEELGTLGIEAHCVIVGDDANLDTARELGFHVLERANELGRKVNDGIEYACREGGADYIAFIGSDDWALPEYLAALPGDTEVRTGAWRGDVSPEGDRLVVSRMKGGNGISPWVIPRPLLEPSGFRPAADERMHGIDGTIWRSLPQPQRVRRGPGRQKPRDRPVRLFAHNDVDELQRVGFKGGEHQITEWKRCLPRARRWFVIDDSEPFARLATRYPADLCEQAAEFYAQKASA